MGGGDHDVDGAIDVAARAVDYDHGAVIEIGDTLRRFLAFAKNQNAHRLAGKDRSLHGIGKFIDVEDGNALNAGHFVEIEIVGDNFGIGGAGQFDEFLIHGQAAWKILVEDAEIEPRHFLEAFNDFEATTAALALQAIGRIGNLLKLVQDESGNSEGAVEEMSFTNIGDATVDQGAGIEKLHGLESGSRKSYGVRQGKMAKSVSLRGADGESEISESKE